MNLQHSLSKVPRLPRKQLSDLANAIPLDRRRQAGRFSEPKSHNIIKINKHKLPLDFFPKKESNTARRSNTRAHFPQQYTEPVLARKIESERVVYSPEKTSFFGFLEDNQPFLQISGGHRVFKRKFQTREQVKRQLFPLEPTRKLNTAAKYAKPDLLELFPLTHTNELNEFLSSKTQMLRSPARRESLFRPRQAAVDPEKSNNEDKTASTKAIENENHNTTVLEVSQGMNITFYNARSSCFPPISRAAN